MRSIEIHHPHLRLCGILLSTGVALLLAGCGGMQNTAAPSNFISTSGEVNPGFSGVLHGGPNPIVGATVKLYATGSSHPGTASDGYGVGTLLAEAVNETPSGTATITGYDTDQNGGFHFNYGTYTCPAKQFVYIVASGGNPGGTTGNNNLITLVAAVGRCEDLTAATTTHINELTTIAAAYTLGHFTSISGSVAANTLAVGIGAPITNNSQTYTDANGHSAGCVSNSFYGTTACPATQAAGLYHAFLNAANLMNASVYSLSGNSGVVNPGTIVLPPVVSNHLMNSIGNTLVACVNSTGTTATGSPCATLLAAGTLNSVAPANTFQAMINIAANPTLSGTGITPAAFLNAATPQTSVYGPILSSSSGTYTNLYDLSLSIFYPGEAKGCTAVSGSCTGLYGLGGSSTINGLYGAYSLGLDIDDNVYVGNQTATGSSSTAGNLISFSSSGTLLSETPNNTTYVQMLNATPDAIGNVYTGSSVSANAVSQWQVAANGTITSTVPNQTEELTGSNTGIAVDKLNDVWATTSATGTNYNLLEIPAPFIGVNTAACGATGNTTCIPVLSLDTSTGGTSGTLGAGATSYYPSGIAIDPNQNIWLADYYANNTGAVTVLQNTGTAAAPAYTIQTSATALAKQVSAITGGENSNGVAFTPTSSTPSYQTWIEEGLTGSGTNTTSPSSNTGVLPVTFTLSGAEVTAPSGGSTVISANEAAQTSGLILGTVVADGAGNLFSGNAGGSGSSLMETTNIVTGTMTNYPLFPCTGVTVSSAAQGCTASVPTNITSVAIDAAGAVWVSQKTSGMQQVFGVAAPTMPLKSLGVVGKP